MSDLISRQDAIDALNICYASIELDHDRPVNCYEGMFYTAIKMAFENLPSAQPKRKTGKWITVHGFYTPGGDPVWACSECGKGIHVYGIEHGTYGADVSDGQWRACPNCGAMMKEGDADD